MKNFTEYFTFDSFMLIAEASLQHQINKEQSSDVSKLKEEKLYSALYEFLLDYNKEHGLPMLANNVGHKTNFGYFWDNFITGNVEKGRTQEENKKSDTRELGRMLNKELFSSFYVFEKDMKNINLGFWQERYQALTKKINEGNFEHYMMPECYCFESGTTFYLGVKKWQPQLLEMVLVHADDNWMKNKYEYKPAPDLSVETKVNLEVEFTSGNLLVADWFRIEEFTKLVDNKNKNDINCTLGRINQTKEYAKEFNFISTPCGGMPHVFKSGNEIIIGNYNEDDQSKKLKTFETKYKDNGRVDCHLRAVTVIDYDQLVQLLTIKRNKEKAEKIVKKYIKENEVIKLKVEPGKYTFEFSGNYELKSHLKEEFPSAITPYLVLKNNLSYEKKITKKNKMN